jgi:hypothetical protein
MRNSVNAINGFLYPEQPQRARLEGRTIAMQLSVRNSLEDRA